MESLSLNGKVAIVTGASRGIGEAVAMAFSQAGANLVLSSRKMENVGPVAEKINAGGGHAIAVAAHAGHPDEVAKLVAAAVDEFGAVDIAVNNAGTSIHFGPVVTADEAVWDKTFQTNLKGYVFLCKEVVPIMRERGHGKIINVASAAGMVPFPGMGVYGAIKAAIIMFTKYLAVELGPYGIQANAIAPGTVRTRLMDTAWQISTAVGGDTVEQTAQATPLRRVGEVEDIVGAALYLASPASDFTSGAVLVVDGAYSIGAGMSHMQKGLEKLEEVYDIMAKGGEIPPELLGNSQGSPAT
ncbi:MAG TPA: SDR family oxidoreductase [Dehalococcoidia bacterium]|nr:SDR family oxidoreductase [Dehalococcoidia bacterium]